MSQLQSNPGVEHCQCQDQCRCRYLCRCQCQYLCRSQYQCLCWCWNSSWTNVELPMPSTPVSAGPSCKVPWCLPLWASPILWLSRVLQTAFHNVTRILQKVSLFPSGEREGRWLNEVNVKALLFARHSYRYWGHSSPRGGLAIPIHRTLNT